MRLCSMNSPLNAQSYLLVWHSSQKTGIWKQAHVHTVIALQIWGTTSTQIGVNNLLPVSMQSSLWRQEQQESVTPYQLQTEAIPSKQSRCSGQLAVLGAADDKHGAGRWSAHTSTISAGSHLWLASQDFSVSRSVSMTLLRLSAVVLHYAPPPGGGECCS